MCSKVGIGILLCLSILGFSRAHKHEADAYGEGSDDQFYDLLDEVDRAEIGGPRIIHHKNLIPDDDESWDSWDSHEEDGDGSQSSMEVDYDDEEDDIDLPSVDVTDDDDDVTDDDDDVTDDDDEDDDDEDDDVVKVTGGRRHNKKPWKINKEKKAKKLERKQQKRKEKRERWQQKKEWRKEKKAERKGKGRAGEKNELPAGRWAHKVARVVEKKLDKGRQVNERMFQNHHEMDVYDEDDDDEMDDDDESDETEDEVNGENEDGRFPHPHHRGRKGRHHRGKPHHGRKPHWKPHHRGGRRGHNKWNPDRPRFHTMPMEERIELICLKIQSQQKERFYEVIRGKVALGQGDVARKSYRLEFVGRMKQCCNMTERRVDCFVSLTQYRYDSFCDQRMPMKPWARHSPRMRSMSQTLNTTCCHLHGRERYDCFNETIKQIHMGSMSEEESSSDSNESSESSSESSEPIVDAESSETNIEELLNEENEENLDSEEDEDEDDGDEDGDLTINGGEEMGRGKGKHWQKRKHHRGQKRRKFRRDVKRKCCHAGRDAGKKIPKAHMRTKCVADGTAYAKHRKVMKAVCGIFYARCCIHTANRTGDQEPPSSHHKVFAEVIPDEYEYPREDPLIGDNHEIVPEIEKFRPVLKLKDSKKIWKVAPHHEKVKKHHHGKKEKEHHDRMID